MELWSRADQGGGTNIGVWRGEVEFGEERPLETTAWMEVDTVPQISGDKLKILFIYRTNLLGAGRGTPNDFGWGIEWLDPNQYQVSSVNAPRRQRRTGYRLLFWLPDFLSARTIRIGLPLEIYPLFRDQISAADHIVCVNDQISLGLLWWRMVGKLRDKKIHCVVMSLPERITQYQVPRPLVGFIASMLRRADSVMTLSDAVHPEFEASFGIERRKLTSVYFGIDNGFWEQRGSRNPDPDAEPYILAVGNDDNRDYNTLVRGLPPGIPLKIVTKKRVRLVDAAKSSNIQILGDWVPSSELRTLYQKARLVVIPVVPVSSESTGLSTILQAMACGTPVVTADGRTLRELFEKRGACEFYRAGDPLDLSRAIRRLWERPDELNRISETAQSLVRQEFTSKALADRISSVLSR